MITTKFKRDFKLTITVNGIDTVIKPPMKVVFSCMKSISGQLNKIRIKVYNLSPLKRLAIVKDVEEVKLIPISFSVGYKDRLELMFKGNINKCSNERRGADLITSIDAYDGGFDYMNSFTSSTVLGGEEVIAEILRDMAHTENGKITPRPVLTRPRVLVGNSVKLINDAIGDDETWYIDDEKLYVINEDNITSSYIPVVSAKSGLISTPTREASLVTFKMLIDPTVKIGRAVKLISKTATHLDGVYKIINAIYDGDNYGEAWVQTCTGMLNTELVTI